MSSFSHVKYVEKNIPISIYVSISQWKIKKLESLEKHSNFEDNFESCLPNS